MLFNGKSLDLGRFLVSNTAYKGVFTGGHKIISFHPFIIQGMAGADKGKTSMIRKVRIEYKHRH